MFFQCMTAAAERNKKWGAENKLDIQLGGGGGGGGVGG